MLSLAWLTIFEELPGPAGRPPTAFASIDVLARWLVSTPVFEGRSSETLDDLVAAELADFAALDD